MFYTKIVHNFILGQNSLCRKTDTDTKVSGDAVLGQVNLPILGVFFCRFKKRLELILPLLAFVLYKTEPVLIF